MNASRQLFVGALSLEDVVRAKLGGPLSAGDLVGALEKGYRWRPLEAQGEYEVTRSRSGRVTITISK